MGLVTKDPRLASPFFPKFWVGWPHFRRPSEIACLKLMNSGNWQLVELRDWENSSRERPAIGPRKGDEIIVSLDAAWCLGCGADALLGLVQSSSWNAES